MFIIIITALLILYVIKTQLFIFFSKKKYKKLSYDELPTVSVIVAARNEEKNILSCMESLNKLVYPEGKLEVIIVNDNSTDTTLDIVNEFTKDKPVFKVVESTHPSEQLKGKSNALVNGIRKSTGKIIFTTDADCTVNPNWVMSIASYYLPDVAVVCGYTYQREDKAFYAMQSYDFMFLLGVASGTMNAGVPLSCIGNNMSYTRKAYDEIGGYESLPFSITEDFQLLMAVKKLKKYDILFPLEADAVVKSEPCYDLKTLYWQKKRWGVGGLNSELLGFTVMFTAFLLNLFTLMAPFFIGFWTLLFIFSKFVADFLFIGFLYRNLKLKFRVKFLFVYELYFYVYILLLPLMVFKNRKVKWKGREFK